MAVPTATAAIPSWVEHADVVIKFIGLLCGFIGILVTTLACLLWKMFSDTNKKVEDLSKNFIDKTYCEQCQKAQGIKGDNQNLLLHEMNERQTRIEASIKEQRSQIETSIKELRDCILEHLLLKKDKD